MAWANMNRLGLVGSSNLKLLLWIIGLVRCNVTRSWQHVNIDLGLVILVVVPTWGQPGPIGNYGAFAANFVRVELLYRIGAWVPLWFTVRRSSTISCGLRFTLLIVRWQQPSDLMLRNRLTSVKGQPATFSLLFRQTQGALCSKRRIAVSSAVSLH